MNQVSKMGQKVIANANPKAMQTQALKRIIPKLAQRDSYAKAMSRATKAGGSNGIGVGY